jgi:hypothetical protein
MNRKAARGSSARARWLHLNPPWRHPMARRLLAGEIRWPGKADDMWLNEGCIITSAFIVCREGKIGKQKKKVETKERNGLPHGAACIKNGEPESNTWKTHLLRHKPSGTGKAKNS